MFTASVIFCQKTLTSMKVLKSFTIFQFVHQYIPWCACFPAAVTWHSITPVCPTDQPATELFHLSVASAHLGLPWEQTLRPGRALKATAAPHAPLGQGRQLTAGCLPPGPCSEGLWEQRRSKDQTTTPSLRDHTLRGANTGSSASRRAQGQRVGTQQGTCDCLPSRGARRPSAHQAQAGAQTLEVRGVLLAGVPAMCDAGPTALHP